MTLFWISCIPKAKAQSDEFPYRMNKKDFFLLPLGMATNFTAGQLSDQRTFDLTIEEISLLDRNSVNAFDRPATYNWNRDLNSASDVFSLVMPILPAALAVPQLYHRNWENVAALGVMYLEVYFFTKGLTVLTKSLTGRIRPYLYNDSFTAEERFNFQGNDAPHASTSFFSGHTSGVFASAVFISKVYTDIYGKNTWSYIIWGTSLAVASFTGYCRVAAGEHFPTDVLAAAMIGGSIGYFIPVLHKKPMENTELTILPNSISLVYNF